MFHTFHRQSFALETIAFQHEKGLFKDLTALCQEMIDACDDVCQKLKESNSFHIDLIIKRCLVALLDHKFEQKYIDIAKIHLNLPLRQVKIGDSFYPNAWMGYAIAQDNRRFDQTRLLQTRQEGSVKLLSLLEHYAQLYITYDTESKTQTIADHFDTQNSRLTKDISPWVDIITQVESVLFFCKWLYPVNYTAEEVASVLLHELGHAIYFVEYLNHVYHMSNLTEDMIEKAKEMTLSDVIPLLDHNDKIIQCLEPSSMVQRIKNASDQIRQVMQQTNNRPNEDDILTRVKTVLKITLFESQGNSFDYLNRKGNDLADTDLTRIWHERGAEEFMVRQGALAARVSYRKKTDLLLAKHVIPIAGVPSVVRLMGKVVNATTLMTSMWSFSNCYISSSYDPVIERMEQMIKATTMVFKDESLSTILKDDYLRQIEEARQIIKDYRSETYVKVRQSLYTILTGISGTVFFPIRLLFNREMQGNKLLQDFTQDLIQSQATIHTAQLDRLKRSLRKS